MENESLFIVDESPDRRLETARQQATSNDLVILNKFEGSQMERDRRKRMIEAKRKQEMQLLHDDPRFVQLEKEKAANKMRIHRSTKRNNNDDESRQAELEAECARKAKSRRLEKENLNIKQMKDREVLIEKVNQRYSFIFT